MLWNTNIFLKWQSFTNEDDDDDDYDYDDENSNNIFVFTLGSERFWISPHILTGAGTSFPGDISAGAWSWTLMYI
jgi:hypothetical protein